MNSKIMMLMAVATVLLASCEPEDAGVSIVDGSGTGDNGQSGGDLTLVGLIKMEPNSTESDFSRALFGRLSRGLSAEYIESSFAPTIDTCEVDRYFNSPTDPVPPLVIFDQRPALISAGENVIVSSSGGTYATLNRQSGETAPYYKTDVPLVGQAPTGLTVDIPGDQFPAFSNVSFTDVPALQITGPVDGQNITPATEITWIANDVPRSVIEIYLGATDPVSNEIIEVGCTVVDDGSFTFAPSVRAEMGSNFIADWSSYLRIGYNVAQSDNAILFTANSVRSN